LYKQLPDLESLRCFVAAAQTHNFRKAAKLVHLSPGAFSERIQRLEEQLGVALFVRSTRHVALSVEGSRLLTHARQLLEEAQAFQHHASTQQAEISLTLGTRYELGLSYLLPILEEQKETHPHWNINLFFGDAPSLSSALYSSDVDVVFSSMRVDNPKLHIQTTHPEHYALVAKPHLASQIHSTEDLKPHTLVDISPSFPLFRYFGEGNQLRPQELFSHHRFLGTISALLYWVMKQDAFAVLPLYFVQEAISTQELTVVLPELEVQHDYFRLFWAKNHWAEAAITQLADFLRAHPLK
jgi:LysR family transcriptional regulator, glycine cleavage system transcriptional activator